MTIKYGFWMIVFYLLVFLIILFIKRGDREQVRLPRFWDFDLEKCYEIDGDFLKPVQFPFRECLEGIDAKKRR